ncbi:MAG: CRISPR-associated protein Csx16 [Roseateles sp.]
MPKRIFVTRHRGAITWAVRHGLRARKVEMSNFDVASVAPGDVVVGTLPVHLIAEVNRRGAHYWHLAMDVPPEARGKELTADEMDAYGARLDEFRVTGLGPRMQSIDSPEAWEDSDGRPVLHLCIATGQALPNVMPIIHGAWDRVVVFASPAMGVQAERLMDVARRVGERRGQTGAPILVRLPADGGYSATHKRVTAELAKLRKDFPEHRVVLNITGGQKLMTLAFADALRSQADIIYCNTDRGQLERIDPPAANDLQLPDDLLDLETYLEMQGLRITRQMRADDEEVMERLKSRERLTATLALRLPQMDAKLQSQVGSSRRVAYGLAAALHDLAATAVDSTRSAGKGRKPQGFQAVQVAELVGPFRWGTDSRKLIQQLVKHGLLEDGSGVEGAQLRLVFTDVAAAVYLSGGYVEEFALLSAAAIGLPVGHFAGNVGIDVRKARADRRNHELNELDLAVVWRNRLLIVECKAGRALMNKSQDILNKSATLRDAVAGLHGSSWILSTAELSASHVGDVMDRAVLNRLTVLDGAESLVDLPQKLAEWAGIEWQPSFRSWTKVLGNSQSRTTPNTARR